MCALSEVGDSRLVAGSCVLVDGDAGPIFIEFMVVFISLVTVLFEALPWGTVSEGVFECSQNRTKIRCGLGKADLACLPVELRANTAGKVGDEEGFARAAVAFDGEDS